MICKDVLREQGRSVTWLAGLLDLERSHVGRMLMGERSWSMKQRQTTALALGVPDAVLFGDLDGAGHGPRARPGWGDV